MLNFAEQTGSGAVIVVSLPPAHDTKKSAETGEIVDIMFKNIFMPHKILGHYKAPVGKCNT
eukprot:11243444-Ditylum_brightwellii.AAC.1